MSQYKSRLPNYLCYRSNSKSDFWFFFFFQCFCFEEQILNPHEQVRKSSLLNLSLRMRKPTIYIGKNKDADQLRGNREADQRPCFRHMDSYYSSSTYIQSFKLLTLSCNCTAWFVWDLGGNPNCWFSHAQAHFINALIGPCGLLT